MTKKRERKRKQGDGDRSHSPVAPGGGGAGPSIPLWVPASLFILLTVWLFRAFIFSDKMLWGNDTLSLGYVARAFYAEQIKHFSFPRWNPQILGGTPFLEALTGGDSLYPPSALLLFLLEPFRALGWKLVVHICAAGFFMFGWMRSLKASRAAALVAGVGYLLSPFLVSWVHPGHDGKIFVTSLAPLLFWATERFFARPGAKSFAGVGLVVALVILTTHFEMAYFLFGGVGLYAIFRSVQLWRGSRLAPAGMRFGLFLAASVVGASAAGVQLIPAVSYVTQFSRRTATTQSTAGQTGRDWSSSWGMHPEEAMGALIAEFPGNNARGSAWSDYTYWGRNVTRDNSTYVGLVLLLLALVAFAGGARPGVRWFFGGLGGVAFLFALGTHTPVWGIFYALVPGIRMFRAPEQAMLLFAVAVPTLGGLGVDRLLVLARDDDDEGWTKVLRVLWIAAGVMILLSLLAGSGALTSLWTSTLYSGIDSQKLQMLARAQPFIMRGAFIAAVLAVATAALAWAVRRHFLAPTALVVGLVILVAVDGGRLDGSFIQTLDFHAWATPDPNLQAMLDRQRSDPEPYRLLDFGDSGQDDTPAMFGVELAAGHHPNDLQRYRELIGMTGSGFPDYLRYPQIRRLLNVRYILWPDQEMGPAPTAFPVVSRTQDRSGRPYQTLLGEPGLDRARLVARAVVKPDGEDVRYMISDTTFDPAAEVVLPEAPPVALDGGPVSGKVTWEERTPNLLRLQVTSDRAALLVIADNWFPSWHATVDGQEAPVLRAYHTLRAVPVQAGDHTVEMFYHSDVVTRSLWLTVVALLVLFGLGGWGMVRERRRAS